MFLNIVCISENALIQVSFHYTHSGEESGNNGWIVFHFKAVSVKSFISSNTLGNKHSLCVAWMKSSVNRHQMWTTKKFLTFAITLKLVGPNWLFQWWICVQTRLPLSNSPCIQQLFVPCTHYVLVNVPAFTNTGANWPHLPLRSCAVK